MLNQSHHLGPNNKLISDSEYSQKFTNYPTELIEFDIEYEYYTRNTKTSNTYGVFD